LSVDLFFYIILTEEFHAVYGKEPMKQKTNLSKSIELVTTKAQYDACCKKLLAQKCILAWIMKYAMKEYECFGVEEIAEKFIMGTPVVATVGVLPDETDVSLSVVTSVTDETVLEGKITYDIRFQAIVPDADKIVEMIINIEAQNDFYPGYPIIKRGIFYCGRMLSSQYGSLFGNSHYEKLQKVYSVWICMNPPEKRKNTIAKYSIKPENLVGIVNEPEYNYDLLTVVMICLGQYEDQEYENDLLGMLNVLLSSDINADDKKQILEEKYEIPMTVEMREEVEYMCNLSDGVEQKGIAKGIEQGIEQTRRFIVINMLRLQKDVEEICACVGCEESYVREIEEEICSLTQ